MPGFGSFTISDYNGEVSTTSFTTGNITAVSLPGALTDFNNLRAAIEGITLGVVKQESLKVFDTRVSNALPGDKNAQRERKWLVVYEDNTPFFDPPLNAIPNEGYHKVFNAEIATADVSLLAARTDEIIIGDPGVPAAVTTFATAWDTLVKSPYGGAARVLKLVCVGRNL